MHPVQRPLGRELGACSWFRCDRPATVSLLGDAGDEIPVLLLGNVCMKHAGELEQTLELYRRGNESRELSGADELALAPASAPDPNRCKKCGHGSAAHSFASLGSPARCVACGTSCVFEGGWLPQEGKP